MDFTNFALIELAGALEAQRAHDRDQRKWLTLWRQMQDQAPTAVAKKPEPESLRPAA